ncbi:MAG: DUF2029 domain-containing protein [Actinobacteria bacterium]|nr:DUF2029 domain-containing protein [Actinomycetota bacterium]
MTEAVQRGARRGPPAPDEPPAARGYVVRPVLQTAFLGILLLWVLTPIAVRNIVAQDALAYIATGQVVRAHPHAIYTMSGGDHSTLSPIYADRWCELAPAGTDCKGLTTAFNWTPLTIPTSLIVGALGYGGGVMLMRLAAALMLATGMWCLWKRLAHRTRHAPHLLIATAILLIPATLEPIVIGQTSPILFLSVCVGLTHPRSRRSIHGAAAWAAATALKATPAMLGVLLVAQRRWRMLAWALGILATLGLLSAIVASPSLWSDYLGSMHQFAGSVTYAGPNRSLDSVLVKLLHGVPHPTDTIITIAVMISSAAAICWFGMRRTTDDTRWAVGYTALLAVSPLVWWHYSWLLIGALGVVLGNQRRLKDSTVAIFPLVALALIPPNIPNVATPPWPVVQSIDFVVLMVLVTALAYRSRAPRRAVGPAPDLVPEPAGR